MPHEFSHVANGHDTVGAHHVARDANSGQINPFAQVGGF